MSMKGLYGMRFLRLPVIAFLMCLMSGAAFAASAASDTSSQFSGSAAVLSSGVMMIEGREVTLWGVDRLASDQQCWHEDRAWDCGEESMIALRHHLAGHHLRCIVNSDLGGGRVIAQCFIKSGTREDDLARYLIAEGWARDHAEDSGGFYAADEDKARHRRRGIWTSRFQSAEDWKNGVANYIEYQQTPPPKSSARPGPDVTSKPH
jgi:hypothetical protein